MKNNKDAFVEKIDLEISNDEIKQTLDEQDFKYEKMTRLTDKEKVSLKKQKLILWIHRIEICS